MNNVKFYNGDRLVAYHDSKVIGKRLKRVSAVINGSIHNSLYGESYSPELLKACLNVKPEWDYYLEKPNGKMVLIHKGQ